MTETVNALLAKVPGKQHCRIKKIAQCRFATFSFFALTLMTTAETRQH